MNKTKTIEKQLIVEDIGKEKTFNAHYSNQEKTEISHLLQWVFDNINAGATHIRWYADSSMDEVLAQPYKEREETDEECYERMEMLRKKSVIIANNILKQEKVQYELLKKKFENR